MSQASGYRQKGAKTGGQNRRKRSLLMNRPANRQRRSLYENYVTILDDVTLESWIEKLKSAVFAFDTETDSLIISPPTSWVSACYRTSALPRMYLSRMIIRCTPDQISRRVLWNCRSRCWKMKSARKQKPRTIAAF
ncbi:hypothetical protein KCP71_05480 [Salmonella enterica subsp. enterica]|nr:hypothetical protein KCP71_05480 [Salmonella enterica subsp. enterica]